MRSSGASSEPGSTHKLLPPSPITSLSTHPAQPRTCLLTKQGKDARSHAHGGAGATTSTCTPHRSVAGMAARYATSEQQRCRHRCMRRKDVHMYVRTELQHSLEGQMNASYIPRAANGRSQHRTSACKRGELHLRGKAARFAPRTSPTYRRGCPRRAEQNRTRPCLDPSDRSTSTWRRALYARRRRVTAPQQQTTATRTERERRSGDCREETVKSSRAPSGRARRKRTKSSTWQAHSVAQSSH